MISARRRSTGSAPRRGSAPGGAAHARPSSGPGRIITGVAVAVIVAAVALVATAAVRDADGGEPSLAPVPVLDEAAPTIESVRPTPTAEALAVTAPPPRVEADALVAEATEVVLVGDSLAEGATPALASILDAAGVPMRIDARSGRGTAEGARALASMAVAPGAVVVVILGTNDSEDRGDAVRNTLAVLGAVPEGTPIRWIDVARSDATVVNEVIEAVATIDPDTEVLAWSAVVADNPGLLISDRIHFTAEGYSTLAAFIATEALGLRLTTS